MNCTTANKLSIAGFLTSKGFNPAKHNDNSFTYCSPLRNEKTASFKVDRIKNLWYDFGTGTGGGLIDLVCEMYRVGIAGALLIISGESQSIKPFSFDRQLIKSSPLIIEKVKLIQAYYLLQYLKERGIPYYIGSQYTKEVHFATNEKKLFAIGFKNDLGGYELRNKFYKGSTSPKAITTIPCRPGNSDTLNIFEGFMDFLSCLTWLNTIHLKNTTIILNSVAHLNKIISHMDSYKTINLFLDNDKAGEEATKRIQDRYLHAIDQAKFIYPGHKDFNEFLTSNKEKPLPVLNTIRG
jgi:DNA primase